MRRPKETIMATIQLTDAGWQWSVSTTEETYGNGTTSMQGVAVKRVASALAVWVAEYERGPMI